MKRLFLFLSCICACIFSVHAQNAFTSPDLKWAGLKGHVKNVMETHYCNGNSFKITYRFNADGKLTYYYNEIWDDEVRISRNKSGRIRSVALVEEPEFHEIKYSYDSNDNVISSNETWMEGGEVTNYTINAYGWPMSAKSEMRAWEAGAGYYYNYTYSYQYSQFDSRGNWTRCDKKGTMTSTNDREVKSTDKSFRFSIVRSIVYY